MKTSKKTREQLLEDNEILRQHISELEEKAKARRQIYEYLPALIADNIPGYVAYVNMDNLCYQFVNSRFEKSFGIPRKKIIGSHIKEILGDDNYAFAEKHLAAVRAGKGTSYENIFNTAEGKRWAKVNYVPDIDNDGKVIGIIVLSYDITERKNAEDKLKQSEERYRELFENAFDAIFIAEPESGIIVDCNESALKLLGRTKSELVGQHQRIIHPPEAIENGFSKSFKQHQNEKQGRILEEKVLTKDGRIRDVMVMASITKSGDKTLLCGTFRDITERKQLYQALKESEERYRVIFEQAPLGIGIISFDGTFLKGNSILETITGYTLDELKDVNISDLYVDTEEREKVLAAVRKQGNVTDWQARFKRKDGKELQASITTKTISIAGEDVLHTMVQDISERVKMEEELQKIQKLESLGLLAGGIAHDFNNLLGGLFGFMDLALIDIRNDISARRHIERAMQCLSRARDLTHQLLTFAKGGMPDKKPVDMQSIIKRSAEIAISGTNIQQYYSLSPDFLMVEADEGQLNQVFTNVFLNSRQAMPNGGNIQVAAYTRQIQDGEIGALPEGAYVFVTIRDDGIGIPPEHLPKILDPFFTTKHAGSGLGLAIKSGPTGIAGSPPGPIGALLLPFLSGILFYNNQAMYSFTMALFYSCPSKGLLDSSGRS